ncbi:hypothetical protein FLGE108171_03500 [Flavobacterium gelidilacus]|jgi:hypothetical protein|uniref:hypothetical protein n=1 Tax=Flavobacterium gelidilacus TaxID=206041 RepID=UPI0003FD1285|nr:hypothetical protein [Flavobacterium gelidilacus]
MYKSIVVLFLSIFLFSCEKDNTKAENEKIIAKNTQTFNLVNSVWNLKTPTLSPTAQNEVANWNEWQQFVIEVNQKPKSNLTAFQLKTKNISSKIDSLQLNIPPQFDKPQVKSRIAALNTKIKMLDTFIHLTDVPQNKIKALIPEINEEISALVGQWEEIIVKKRIPKEVGEEYMIKALDTARNANPELMMEKMKQQDSINNSLNKRKSPFINKK